MTNKEIKKYFEENYLDGDKIQDGQMLSSEVCFDAIIDLCKAQKSALLKSIDEGVEKMKKEERMGDFKDGKSWHFYYNQALSDIKELLKKLTNNKTP